MSSDLIILTPEQFEKQYPLIPNHLVPSSYWGNKRTNGLFETFGEELAFVHQHSCNLIWTLLSVENNAYIVTNGYWRINRIGFLISTRPVPEGMNIEVHY